MILLLKNLLECREENKIIKVKKLMPLFEVYVNIYSSLMIIILNIELINLWKVLLI